MRIAIIGAGNVGAAIASRLAGRHQVKVGTRDPGGARGRAATDRLGERAAVVSIADALAETDVVVIAVPGTATDDLLAQHGAGVDGRIVIDATNRIAAALGDQPVLNNMAAISAAAPRAAVFRAFNSLGWENFAEPQIGDVQADLLFAGPDGPPRESVETLIADVGLRPIYVGGPEGVPLVDALGSLWGALAFRREMGRRLFFKVVTP